MNQNFFDYRVFLNEFTEFHLTMNKLSIHNFVVQPDDELTLERTRSESIQFRGNYCVSSVKRFYCSQSYQVASIVLR